MTKRTITVGGVTVNVVDDETAEAADALICVRCSGFPIPLVPSDVCPCARCGARVWASRLSPKTPPRICMECAMAMAQAKERRG